MQKNIVIALISFVALGWLGLAHVLASSALDELTPVPEAEMMEISVGADLSLTQPVEQHVYAIFNPTDIADSGVYCAYITAEELSFDNNLTHYGTCFINDSGEFSIVELSEDVPASYQDMKNSFVFVSEKLVRVVDFDQLELTATPSPTMPVEPSPNLISTDPPVSPGMTEEPTPFPTEEPILTPTSTTTPDPMLTPTITPTTDPVTSPTPESTPTVQPEVTSSVELDLVPTDIISPEPTTHVSPSPAP